MLEWHFKKEIAMKRLVEKGMLKTLRIKDAPSTSDVKPRGRKRIAALEEKSEGIEIVVGEETIYAEVVEIDGPSRVVSSTDDPRIETYAAVWVTSYAPKLHAFIVSHGTTSMQVLALSEFHAREMHPKGATWHPRKAVWKLGEAEVEGWPAPSEVKVIEIGTDEYAEVPEVVYVWEWENSDAEI